MLSRPVAKRKSFTVRTRVSSAAGATLALPGGLCSEAEGGPDERPDSRQAWRAFASEMIVWMCLLFPVPSTARKNRLPVTQGRGEPRQGAQH